MFQVLVVVPSQVYTDLAIARILRSNAKLRSPSVFVNSHCIVGVLPVFRHADFTEIVKLAGPKSLAVLRRS